MTSAGVYPTNRPGHYGLASSLNPAECFTVCASFSVCEYSTCQRQIHHLTGIWTHHSIPDSWPSNCIYLDTKRVGMKGHWAPHMWSLFNRTLMWVLIHTAYPAGPIAWTSASHLFVFCPVCVVSYLHTSLTRSPCSLCSVYYVLSVLTGPSNSCCSLILTTNTPYCSLRPVSFQPLSLSYLSPFSDNPLHPCCHPVERLALFDSCSIHFL